MAKKTAAKKKRQPDYQQVARKVLDAVAAPDAEPKAMKPAKERARPKSASRMLKISTVRPARAW